MIKDETNRIEAYQDTIKYWFNACGEKQKEINKLQDIVALAETYMSSDPEERDSIDFWNALYEYRGDE